MKHITKFNQWLNEALAPVPDTMIEDGLEIVQGLVDRGFDPKVAAALAGNMWQESRFDPAVRPESATYVGLIQWGDYKGIKTGPGARKTNLLAKPNWKNLDVQLDYLKTELDGAYKSVVPAVMSAPTLQKAAEIVARKYEGCADPTNPNRLNSAAQLYTAWQASQAAPTPTPTQVEPQIDDTEFGEPATTIN
jgi:hypothetical protein